MIVCTRGGIHGEQDLHEIKKSRAAPCTSPSTSVRSCYCNCAIAATRAWSYGWGTSLTEGAVSHLVGTGD
jgi:hypothetical protein